MVLSSFWLLQFSFSVGERGRTSRKSDLSQNAFNGSNGRFIYLFIFYLVIVSSVLSGFNLYLSLTVAQ